MIFSKLSDMWSDDLLAFAMVLAAMLPVFVFYPYFDNSLLMDANRSAVYSFVATGIFWLGVVVFVRMVSRILGRGRQGVEENK